MACATHIYSFFQKNQNFTPKCHHSLMLTSRQPEGSRQSCKR